jgi:hypothetical protein
MSEDSNRAFFSKLASHYDALAMIEDTAKAFLIIGCLTAVTAVFTNLYGLIEAGVYLIGAVCIRRYWSRAAAAILLALSSLVTCLIFATLVGFRIDLGGGAASIIFALVGVWAGARALEATIKLRGSLAAGVTTDDAGA